ncbi:flagellar basal-body rod protein FlgG [Desulfatibacillum alkenivorans DSM 16219]|jgi:flagellar basal-body rod protein FlgG|uniref:Flagellar basal-body rod protein FlgG n=1 Tax=Desulfatibacillum alkenivorans DSM 16219 TaxID=1121393 RepID=A0A1M6HKG2_9BACT|nr:flagellar hook basal-body protein [Desulfatibacillum alkenivorans]SHJ22652.1 flagellar basal-body rod protein FlgG [Desulfatibacillum alkenivorans DSM 16219]
MNIGTIYATKGFYNEYERFEVISNNLANVSTPGFKRDIFALDKNSNPYTKTDMSEGPVQHTGNELDFSIQGEGFFEMQGENGLRYTRQGRFLLNADKEIVNAAGDKLLSDRGDPIVVDGGDLSLAPDGTLMVDGKELETIAVVNFENPKMLSKEGAAYYVSEGGAGERLERPEGTIVNQGYLEQSNVIVPQEMVKMMESLRTYETFQKYMNTASEMNTKAVSEVGTLR